MPSPNEDLLLVAEMTVRHLAEMIEEPPRVYPGLLQSTSNGIGMFFQDVTSTPVQVVNKVASAPHRVIVQFNPSGSAFVLQTI